MSDQEFATKTMKMTPRAHARYHMIRGRDHLTDYTFSEIMDKFMDCWERDKLLEETE